MRAWNKYRMPVGHRFLAMVWLVAGAGMVLSACSSAPPSSSPSSGDRGQASVPAQRSAQTSSPTQPGVTPATSTAELVDRAVTTTDASRTMHATMNATMNLGGSDGTVTITGDGDVALNPMQLAFRVQMTMGSSGLTININERMVDGNIYMTFPYLSESVPGKSWVEVPTGQAISGLDPSSTSPASSLALLAAGGSGAIRLGTATVDGVSTTEYAMNVNAARAKASASSFMKALPPSLSQTMVTELKSLGMGTVGIHAWIDGSGLIRKIEETIPLTIPNSSLGSSNAPGSTTTTESVEVDYSSFGEAVTVAAPPAQEVATWAQFSQAMSSMGTSSGG